MMSTDRLRSARLRQRSASFKQRSRQDYVQVTDFLLGGNITDPLNLSSIDTNEQNQKTPVCSPAPTPQHSKEIDILIPADVNDPLKLNNNGEIKESSELCHLLISPNKVKRTSKRKRTESDSIVNDLLKDDKRMKLDLKIGLNFKDKIVSPVVPQSSERYHHGSNHQSNHSSNHKRNSTNNVNSASFHHPPDSIAKQPNKPPNKHQSAATEQGKRPFIFQSNQNQFYYANGRKFNLKDQKFQFGNYNRYYGYRNQNQNQDLRIALFKREWFLNKTVLDIGCNVGYVTCTIARDFLPKKIVGLDIDSELIEKSAKRNIRHYLENKTNSVGENKSKSNDQFPVSLSICHGPLSEKETNKDDENKANKQTEDDKLKDDQLKVVKGGDNTLDSTNQFPNNIQFIAANYVLPNDQLLSTQKPEYDCILCLSVTKWVHLNFGDTGLKRMFKRIYKQLNNNGILILEPQPIWSYKRKKALTVCIRPIRVCVLSLLVLMCI